MANQGSLLSSRENQGRTQIQYVFSLFSLLSVNEIVPKYNTFLLAYALLTRNEYMKKEIRVAKIKAFTHVPN